MSVKINFVRGDEVLTTTMSVGRTMLDAAKKLNIPEIPAIVELAMFILILNGSIKLNLWILALWNYSC